jgi:hypothetical protein
VANEKLYNGIELTEVWPPKDVDLSSREPAAVPYLIKPPEIIPIHLGRQLFVDDFLIESTNLSRTFHTPTWYEHNPILSPETPLEMNDGVCPVAAPFNDGVFYDAEDKLFKMWYHAGWFDGIGYATSRDGLHWERPSLDIELQTNRVLASRPGYRRDGVGVWLDHDTDNKNERYKMFAYFRTPEWEGGEVYTSPDGIHWSDPVRTGPCGDNTTIFYNPFRKKWVYSVRTSHKVGEQNHRTRSYVEHDSLIEGAQYKKEDVIRWAAADDLDPPHPVYGYQTQLYNIDTVAYESLMIGLYQIHQGPPNEICEKEGFPKITDLMIAFSRDGFHYDRSYRKPFLACSHEEGTWNRAYLHSAGGCCLVVGNELYFYVGGFSGISPKQGSHIYAGGHTGLAKLRRDGFASMDSRDGQGELKTRPVIFDGSCLFVNADTTGGELRVEILDQDDQVVTPFSREACIPITIDSTKQQVEWAAGADLSSLKGKPAKFKFYLEEGKLYSFWVSADAGGASGGYMAAGGPGIIGATD